MGRIQRVLHNVVLGVLLAFAGCGKESTPHGDGGGPGNVGHDGGSNDGGSGDGGSGVDTSLSGPPLDPTVPVSFADAVRFIYDGENPVQTGVTPGAIDEARVVVLRGHVRSRDGQPIKDAVVSVVGSAAFGSTRTRVDGWFDLAANGGGVVRVSITAPGYFSVQRQAVTPWRDWVILPEVVLTPADAKVTAITPGASSFQVASGSVITDSDGTRQASIFFPPGTTAEAVLPDGGTQTLSSMHVRATEYTVGSDGPAAMPAMLPPTSAYTYAAELSVDEAGDLAATSVRFNGPVIGYIDNFLQMPIGTTVPVGYYDRTRGVWVPSADGQVLKLLSVTGGLADLDLDGDGVADSSPTLARAGISDAERSAIATNYGNAARSFWRFTTSHFSIWDTNFPAMGPPGDARYPPDRKPGKDHGSDKDSHCSNGSIIECENQTLGETIPLAGTPFSLRYRSDTGSTDTGGTRIVLTDDTPLPASLLEIQVRVTGAGRVYETSFSPKPNLSYYFRWDGKDAYGRTVPGEQEFTAEVIYVFPLIYGNPNPVLQNGSEPGDGGTPASFGQIATAPLTVAGRQVWHYSRSYTFTSGRYLPPQLEFGHWTIDVHHRYQLDTNTIYRGDGRISQPVDLRSGARLILGGGTALPAEGLAGTDVDLMPFLGMTEIIPLMAAGPDGTIYVTISARATLDNYPITRIWGLKPNGKLTLVAGFDSSSIVLLRDLVRFDEDDVPATQTTFQSIQSITSGPDGSLYVAQYGYTDGDTIIRKIGADGIIRRVAGARGTSGRELSNGPALEAALGDPGRGLGVDAWGNIYISDPAHNRVRRVDSGGVISTYAFNALPSTETSGRFTAEGQFARTVSMSHPINTRIADDGTMYVTGGVNQIVRIGADGIARTFGGSDLAVPDLAQSSCAVSGACSVQWLDVDPGQDLTFTGFFGPFPIVRRSSVNGAVSAVTAVSRECIPLGAPAAITCIDGSSMWGLGHLPTGELLIGTSYQRLLKISARPFENSVPSDDGTEIFVFDPTGRHLKTLHARTLTTKYEFRYDAHGLLTAILDGSGNQTSFERNAAGRLTGIVSPFGVRTAVSFDVAGNLAEVLDAANNRTTLVSELDGGLLTQLVDPRGGIHEFAYDESGRLTSDVNAAGETVELSRVDQFLPDDYTVTKKTTLGRTTTFDMSSSGGVRRRVTTDPAGLVETRVLGNDASITNTRADGMTTTILEGPDPLYGMLTPVVRSAVFKTPAGLTRTVTAAVQVVGASSPSGPFDFSSRTESVSVNGKTTTGTFDVASRKWTLVSPLGRQTQLAVDVLERPVEQRISGLAPMSFAYDARGRLSSITQGDRTWTYSYDPSSGYLTSIVDPRGRARSLTPDGVGRPIGLGLPGGRSLGLSWDQNSNPTSLMLPSSARHDLAFTPANRLASYTAPSVGPGNSTTGYSYDLDGLLTSILLPDGSSAAFEHDPAGRISAVQTTRTRVALVYGAQTGQVIRLDDALATGQGAQGSSLQFGYDGPLVTSVSWTGAVAGAVSYSYTPEFLIAGTAVAGTPSVLNTYDDDQILTKLSFNGGAANTLTLNRDPQNGSLIGSSIGPVTTAQSYDQYGLLTGLSASSSGSTVYSVILVTDAGGRVQQRTETIQGVTHTYGYTYDVADRLTDLTVDGNAAGHWSYDPNGNRLTTTLLGSPGTTLQATYDSQDRLLTLGQAGYAFGPNGDLQSRTVGGQTATYHYDTFGALSDVLLPSGDRIEYVLDALGRRVGKKLNGVFQRGWLYDGIHPIAEFDGSGAVVARFAYGSQGNVPDLIWKAGTLYRVLSDERGSPRLVVNAVTGLVAQRLDYDVWGNVVADTTPGFQPFGFAGGLYDPDTKLIRFGARDYDPETGRWTAKDAVRFRGGFNLYLYSGNDPISRIDPSGEFALAIAGAFIGAGVNGLYAWQTGGDVTNAILIGAGVGFVTGLIPIPWLSGALFGAGTTLANRFAVNCENTLPWYVDVGINALAGAAGGQLGEILGKASVTTTIAASDAAGDLGALIGGAASGVWTADLLQANDLLDALKQ